MLRDGALPCSETGVRVVSAATLLMRRISFIHDTVREQGAWFDDPATQNICPVSSSIELVIDRHAVVEAVQIADAVLAAEH